MDFGCNFVTLARIRRFFHEECRRAACREDWEFFAARRAQKRKTKLLTIQTPRHREDRAAEGRVS